jgi:hypothetical protein
VERRSVRTKLAVLATGLQLSVSGKENNIIGIQQGIAFSTYAFPSCPEIYGSLSTRDVIFFSQIELKAHLMHIYECGNELAATSCWGTEGDASRKSVEN